MALLECEKCQKSLSIYQMFADIWMNNLKDKHQLKWPGNPLVVQMNCFITDL